MTKEEEKTPTIESVFNKHSWNALRAISPSKDFCLLAMKEWSEIENKRLSDALDYNVRVNIDLMKKLVGKQSENERLKAEREWLGETTDEQINQLFEDYSVFVNNDWDSPQNRGHEYMLTLPQFIELIKSISNRPKLNGTILASNAISVTQSQPPKQ